MPFGLWTQVGGPKEPYITWGRDPPGEGAIWRHLAVSTAAVCMQVYRRSATLHAGVPEVDRVHVQPAGQFQGRPGRLRNAQPRRAHQDGERRRATS